MRIGFPDDDAWAVLLSQGRVIKGTEAELTPAVGFQQAEIILCSHIYDSVLSRYQRKHWYILGEWGCFLQFTPSYSSTPFS